jgi:uncharacterized RDD family membrane protein YckC
MDQAVTTPGLLRRLAAMGYDSLLVFSLMFAATGLYQLVAHWILGTPSSSPAANGDIITELQPVASGPWFTLYLLLVMYAFFAWFWHRSGQTLGMQAWRLRVDDVDGGRISYQQTLQRFAGAWVSALCLGMGYLWALFDRDKRSWHDRLSHSRVVQLPKKKT